MAKSCVLIPQVKNNNGEIVSSKLFNNLLHYLPSRLKAVQIYTAVIKPEFLNKLHGKLQFDDNNEPTLSSLILNTTLSEKYPEDKFVEYLNNEIGHFKQGFNELNLLEDNSSNRSKLSQKVLNFNNNSDLKDVYTATIQTVTKEGKRFIVPTISKASEQDKINTAKLIADTTLNNKLREILMSKGISIGALNELDKRLGVSGVTDFSKAKELGNGFIELIRLAQGVEGENALPEEFSHFIIETMENNNLLNRLLNVINNDDIIKEILGEEYQTYSNLYKDSRDKLLKEAAGKLLAKHLIKNHTIPNTNYKSLLQRFIQAVKNFFSKFNVSDIKSAMLEADIEYDSLAKNILGGKYIDKINIANIKSKDIYYQVDERIARDRKLLSRIIENELKRFKIYEQRTKSESFKHSQKAFITKLESTLISNLELEGINIFLDKALTTITSLNNKLAKIASSDSTSIQERASILRDIRNYMYSYSDICKDLRSSVREDEKFENNRYSEDVRRSLDQILILLEDLSSDFDKVSKPLFVEFLKPYMGQSITIPYGKDKGKIVSVEQLIEKADKDISFFDRWLDSMSDSSDNVLKLIDKAVKTSKNDARIEHLDIKKRLEKAGLELEKAGIKDFDWMFETDDNGNKNGKYLHKEDWKKFKEDMQKAYNSYKDLPYAQKIEAQQAWYNSHTIAIDEETRIPDPAKYTTQAYKNLNQAQKNFYETIMEIKKELDSYLPDNYTTLHNTIKIRKNLLERIKSSDSVKEGTKEWWESVKDTFLKRSDDVEFSSKAALQDFEGRQVQNLPVYYTKLGKNESENDISTDIVSTMTAYAAMALDYKHMNKIIDVLEIGRIVVREREVSRIEGDKPLETTISALGRKVKSPLNTKGDNTYIMQRLNDFFTMQVYGRYMADEGTFGKSNIDKAKALNFLNKLTSINRLGFNPITAISNLATGKVMMRIESLSKQFFTEANTIKADRIYGSNLPQYLAEIGSRVKVSKLALWNELFDTLQDYDTEVLNTEFDRKSIFSKMFSTNTLFFMSNAGEHWMQTRTSLALADAYKMKSPSGKIVNLWDAMEVQYLDNSNPKLGAKLVIKEGYTKADGTAFTQKDIFAFKEKSAKLNQRMHGIYNRADRNALQRLALGRLAMTFRKWIKPSLNRRYAALEYDQALGEWTEGFYRTTGRFLVNLYKDIRQGEMDITAQWDNLTDLEKFNIKKAFVELGHFLIVTIVLGLIDWSDDDDEEQSWFVNMLELQARRLKTEIGAMIPGLPMVREGLRIVKSPAAAVNTGEELLNIINLLNPFAYMDEIESGRYKGHSRAYKSLMDSPLMLTNETLYRAVHPEELIPFYKQ